MMSRNVFYERSRNMGQIKLWEFDTPVTDEAVLLAWQGRADYWLTRRQIATAMHRVKAPAVNNRCENLVARGVLFKQLIKLPNGVDMITYLPNYEHEICQFAGVENA